MYDRIKEEIERSRVRIDRLKTHSSAGISMDSEIRLYTELLLRRISFFQHERLIHLMVLILFALLTFGSVVVMLVTGEYMIGIAAVLFLALLIPYIVHYYHLENGVQRLYSLYDEIAAFLEGDYE
ncbi:MAG: hypothetical protein PHF65_03615 [Oscillospiraceae bacterium]|nr:hypothetical protein [Oscillospiraceae bacterium]